MATRSATGELTISYRGSITNTPTSAESGQVASAAVSKTQVVAFATGLIADSIDRAWLFEDATLGASVTDTINGVDDILTLTQGAGSTITNNIGFGAQNDNLGQTFAIVDLAGLVVFNTGTTTIRITPGTDADGANAINFWNVNGTPASGEADTIDIPSGGFFAVGGGEDGWSTVGGTTNAFRLTNLDASAGQYSILILGRSA